MDNTKMMRKIKVVKEYMKGTITISEAAKRAKLSVWEMERYLVENGFKSAYSIEDLEREIRDMKG